jgi:Zn-dependent M28 family amino/carboxypeptidase
MRNVLRLACLGLALLLIAALSSSIALAGQPACRSRNNNTVDKLLECVTLEGVQQHLAAFQAIADANGGSRAAGTSGYDQSAAYVAETMSAAGYDVTVQPFTYYSWRITGQPILEQISPDPISYNHGPDFLILHHTDSGDVTAPVTAVDLQLGLGNRSTSGCELDDFATFPPGHIALIQRGACTFRTKTQNAAAAGAAGAIVFSQGHTPNDRKTILGTLSAAYNGGIPAVSASYALGEQWAGTPGLVMHLETSSERLPRESVNILAESATGDPSNAVVVGAHLDSVSGRPGIQDNGSGSAVILEVALQMQKVKPRNTLRFAWWGAEELGLVGSNLYMDSLSQKARDSIALYLNFDMIASPNYVWFIYDGDGSAFGFPGPPGSGAIETLFESFYAGRGLPSEPTQITFRSDYTAFFESGIPIGGLFTGAEGIKSETQAALFGGTAGQAYDPCYHRACDTYSNVSLEALDVNADATAFVTLQYAMNTQAVNDARGKGNFKPPTLPPADVEPAAR